MSDEIAEQDKTPVTLITGFLGSGKTTLVNYILKEQRDWKICVVENEFGEVPIDNALVEENLAAKEDIITMDNGCVCCSIRGDLVRTFGMLVSRRKTFDAIIIETTGVADPSPIIFTFNSNVLLQDNFRLDSVVCLVDSKHIGIHLDEKKPDGNVNEAENQIAFADRIILNKLDLVGNEELEELEERIRSINSFAKLIKTERSRVPLDQILNLNSFSLEKLVEMDPTLMEEDDEHDHEHSHDHGSCTLDHDHTDGCGGHVHDEHCHHDHDSDHVHDEHCDHGDGHEHGHDHHDDHHGHHEHHKEKHDRNEHHHKEHHHDEHHHDEHHHDKHHDEHHHDKHHDEHHHHKDEHVAKKKKKTHNLSLITSVGFTIEGLLDVPRFNTFMTQLLQVKAADIYRSKGVLAFADQGDLKFVFQGVHDQVQFGPSEKPWGPDESRLSKMVFIGKNLDHEHFRENLLQCTIDPQNAKITVHKRQ
eukprot:CAMPEP_0173149736 /NCGR_PEP_ID=MMETSP1105-20130129/10512_1 /TAXON_ID=2985 /ORGANISM="Ochromonas sp., Strain BG-1" /LENGTH=474 /DNA_ID=CAMNT_0014064677 /DNA_START=30 /DNA_END=1454 /DNA_ORIENTATION=-